MILATRQDHARRVLAIRSGHPAAGMRARAAPSDRAACPFSGYRARSSLHWHGHAYIVGLQTGELLVARMQNIAGHRPGEFHVGNEVHVRCDADDIQVLTA